ncbi:unnamed protein product [Effrenium voratum]|nr:unnamed protein product [Effrenium voratum]
MTSVSVGAPVPSESRRWSGPELLALAASQGGAYLGFGLQYALLTPFVLELGVPVRWASIIWLVFSTLQRSAIKAKRIAVSFPNEAMSVLRCLVFFGVVAYGAAMKSSMSALRSIVNGTGSQAPGLSQMQLAVQQLLGNAGSPGMTDFSAQLDKVIEEQMKKAVLTSKGTLQTELDGHYSSGYDACDASLSTSQGTDGVLDKKTSVFTAAAAQHKTCRTQEAADATAKDTCDSQESELKTKKEAACKVVSDYDSSTVTNCARQGGESYVTYTGRLVVYYQAELEKAKKAEELCETATKARVVHAILNHLHVDHLLLQVFRSFNLQGLPTLGASGWGLGCFLQEPGLQCVCFVPTPSSPHQGYFYVGSSISGELYIYEVPLLEEGQKVASSVRVWSPLKGNPRLTGLEYHEGYIFVSYDEGLSTHVLIFRVLASGMPGELLEEHQVDVVHGSGVAARQVSEEKWEIFFVSGEKMKIYGYGFRFVTGFEPHDFCAESFQAPKAHFAKARGGSLAGLVAVMLLGVVDGAL